MVALNDLDNDIEGLDYLCERALEDASAAIRLVAMLGPDDTPLKQPTGLGNELDRLVRNAAVAADAVRVQHFQGTRAGFDAALLELRYHLVGIAGEVARLRDRVLT